MQVASALSTYELNADQKADVHLDVVTGFVMTDEHMCVAVLEGVHDKGLSRCA